jgi:superfamily I DNA and/or RNA helicase
MMAEEDIEAEELDKYDIRQFLMDTSIRFYSSNVASIEINYKNALSKVMFRIPPFCTFLSHTSQHRMIYEANHESHVEKLEDFFNKKKIFKAEMKAIQRLSRRSKMLRWGSEKWRGLSQITLAMVLVINLLFVAFYDVDDDGVTINLAYREAEITIELLGII